MCAVGYLLINNIRYASDSILALTVTHVCYIHIWLTEVSILYDIIKHQVVVE